MLYDPKKWEKPAVQAESRMGFLLWLEAQNPAGCYRWASLRECPIGRYCLAHWGSEVDRPGRPLVVRFDAMVGVLGHAAYHAITMGEVYREPYDRDREWTFGRAVQRAKAYAAEHPRWCRGWPA
jgi:hypothetical protein